jgi:nitroreductase
MNIVDDRYGFRPAGTEKWIKSGFLDERNIMPLSQVERQACYYMFSEPAVICQNMFLATEALGIGGWMHCGFLSRDVFKALALRQ